MAMNVNYHDGTLPAKLSRFTFSGWIGQTISPLRKAQASIHPEARLKSIISCRMDYHRIYNRITEVRNAATFSQGIE